MRRAVNSITKHFSSIPKEEAEALGGHGLILGNPNGISPLVVYRFLKKNYGAPQEIIRTYSEYDKVHWTFFLKGRNSILKVHDWKLFSWSIGVAYPYSVTGAHDYELANKYEKEAMPEARLLLSYITRYAKSTGKITTEEARYQLINNLFLEHYERGNQLLEILKDNSTSKILDYEMIGWSAVMSYMLSVEALINTVYEIYLREEIRDNSDLRDHVEKLSPLYKWCLASFLCSCFEKCLERTSKGHQRLREIWRMRNSMVHGKLSEEMRTYFIREDNIPFATGKDPILTDRQYEIEKSEEKFVREIRQKVDEIKKELLNAMSRRHKKIFSESLKYKLISFDRAKKQIASPRHDFW